MKYALFINDQFSLNGVGFKILPMSEQEYDLEVKANFYLRENGQKTPSFSILCANKEDAMKEARASFSKEVWNKLF